MTVNQYHTSTDLDPTETSPLLLNKPSSPTAKATDISSDLSTNASTSNGSASRNREQEPGRDEENVEDSDSVLRKGLPEMHMKLKYIVPAMAIGVGRLKN